MWRNNITKQRRIMSILLAMALVLASISTNGHMVKAATGIAIDQVNFPDAVFRKYISENFDINNNGSLSQGEIDAVTTISFRGEYSYPTDFTGIKTFTNLESLTLGGGDENRPIKMLDVSGLQKLGSIECSSCGLEELYATGCSELGSLDCSSNNIRCLELTGSPVYWIDCSDNCLAGLDLSQSEILYENISSQKPVSLTAMSYGVWKVDLNELPGVDYRRVTIDPMYLDGATVDQGVIVWEDANDVPDEIEYEYEVPNINRYLRLNVTVHIEKEKLDISKCNVSLGDEIYTYYGGENRPPVTVDYDGIVISPNNYNVEYFNNVKAGTAKVTVKGKGEATGSKTVTFTINPRNIEENDFLLDRDICYYTGNQVRPVRTSDYAPMTGSDYSISYYDNINVGTATATISGKNNYCGMITKNFEIIATDLDQCQIDFDKTLYVTGENPKVSIVTPDGNEMKQDIAYTVRYENNQFPGVARAVIEGKGYCYGSRVIEFTVVEQQLTTTKEYIPPTAPYPTTMGPTRIKEKEIPPKGKILGIKNTKTRKIKISLKKVKGVSGYQINYSTKKSMKKSRVKFVKKTKITLKGVKKKKYYFRVRAYKIYNNTRFYGKWSDIISVKVRK